MRQSSGCAGPAESSAHKCTHTGFGARARGRARARALARGGRPLPCVRAEPCMPRHAREYMRLRRCCGPLSPVYVSLDSLCLAEHARLRQTTVEEKQLSSLQRAGPCEPYFEPPPLTQACSALRNRRLPPAVACRPTSESACSPRAAAGRGAAAERRRVIIACCAAPHSRRALSPAQKVLDNDQQSRAPHSRRARPRPQSGGPRGRLRTRGSDGGGGPLRVGQMHSGTGRARLCCARFAGPCRPAIRKATLHGDDGTKPRNPAPPPPRGRGSFEIAHLALRVS